MIHRKILKDTFVKNPDVITNRKISGFLRIAFFCAIALLLCSTSYGRQRAMIAFYNVENLYDTIVSASGNDSDYTPGGRMKWNTDRYRNKLANISRVLDELDADIVGLAEVEGENVVRDLVMTLETDYNYIHLSGGDYRGMDLAVLYKGDKFVPEEWKLVRIGSSREVLYVRGELYGERIDLLVCHLPSQMNSTRYRDRALKSLARLACFIQENGNAARVILAGDFNTDPSERVMRRHLRSGEVAVDGNFPLFCPFASLAAKGIGSYAYDNRWRLYDNIFLSTRFLGGDVLRYDGCGIFIRPWLMDDQTVSRKGYPFRTFSSGAYLGGYSDHLPVFISLTVE